MGAGIKTRDEARAELGLGGEGKPGAGGLGKYNHNHDRSNGQFTTADGAIAQADLQPPPIESHQSTKQVLPAPTFDELRSNPTFRAAVFQALKDSGVDLAPTQRREQGFWVFQDQSTGDITTVPMTGNFGLDRIDPDSPADLPGSVVIGWAHTHPFAEGEPLPFFPRGVPIDIIKQPSDADLALSTRLGLPGFLVTKDLHWNSWSAKGK